jgi:CheY-like chemotaxis protein
MKIKNLLIIDDDEIGNMYLSMILSDFNFVDNFRFEQSGWDALDLLGTIEDDFPEIILVDLNMPEMDGFDFIEKYETKFYCSHPNTRLLVMTNSILEIDKKKSLNYRSVFNFINKPLTEDILHKAISGITA